MTFSRTAVMATQVTLFARLATLFIGLAGSSTAVTVPAPIVVPQSQYWEGNDGPWSTFALRVGNPPQEMRVLVSTQFPNAIVKINETCEGGNNSPCANDMGKTFAPNSSTTYDNQGVFNLYPELNFTTEFDRAYYGFDTLGFGYNKQQGPAFDKQIIASTNTDHYYFGLLGVNPQPTNFTDFSDPMPSLFKTLQDNNSIPSLSYSYTAGAPYRFKKVLGSFVFGGYDASRVELNDLDFNMADDVSRDLVVGLQSITSEQSDGTSKQLLDTGILALVDTTLPYIVLPIEACDLFEQAFQLNWNDTLELYTVTNAVHNHLSNTDLNITFLLGNSENGGSTVPIKLPYSAFDLTAQDSLTGAGDLKYFPLKRASNETQYTIGRAFFQEAMLIANYEQGNFSISQCVWNEDAQQTIEVIHKKGYVWPTSPSGNSTTSTGSGSSRNTAAIGAGVGVGGAVIIALILFLTFAYRKRKWPFHNRPPSQTELDSKPVIFEGDGRRLSKQPLPGDMHEAPSDVKNGYYGTELAGSDGAIHKSELPGSGGAPGGKPELSGGAVYRPGDHHRGELVGSDGAREVEGSGIVMELAGSPVPHDYYTSRRGSSPKTSLRSPLMGSRRGSSHPGNLSPLGDSARSAGESESIGFLGSPISTEDVRRGSRGRSSNGSRAVSRGNSEREISREVSRDGKPPEGYF